MLFPIRLYLLNISFVEKCKLKYLPTFGTTTSEMIYEKNTTPYMCYDKWTVNDTGILTEFLVFTPSNKYVMFPLCCRPWEVGFPYASKPMINTWVLNPQFLTPMFKSINVSKIWNLTKGDVFLWWQAVESRQHYWGSFLFCT